MSIEIIRSRYPDARLNRPAPTDMFCGPWQVVAARRVLDNGALDYLRPDKLPLRIGRGPTPDAALNDAAMSWTV